jgi:hypothetical protein
VTAAFPGFEKITITMPPTVLEGYRMVVVIPHEGDLEGLKANPPVTFFHIPLRFFDFSDHAIVHKFFLLFRLKLDFHRE